MIPCSYVFHNYTVVMKDILCKFNNFQGVLPLLSLQRPKLNILLEQFDIATPLHLLENLYFKYGEHTVYRCAHLPKFLIQLIL